MRPSGITRAMRMPVGIVAILVLALAACSSSSPGTSIGGGEPSTATSESTAPGSSTAPASSTGTGSTADACALATVDDAATAYGFTAGAANASPPADTNYAYCEYTSADGNVTVQTYVSFTAAALMIYDGYKNEADETVSGVGDEAFWAGDVLYIKKGSVFAGIRLAPSSDDGSVDSNEAAVALGRIIAGNM